MIWFFLINPFITQSKLLQTQTSEAVTNAFSA
jgi:hypothetical protein